MSAPFSLALPQSGGERAGVRGGPPAHLAHCVASPLTLTLSPSRCDRERGDS